MPQPVKRKIRSSACYNQKGKWSKADDAKLVKLVEQLGVGQWSEIAQKMPGRIGKQCRERWQNHLQPGIRLEPWSLEEEEQLVAAHRVHGNKWSNIAQIIPGRPENHIKNYWNATLRRKDPMRPDGVPSLLKRYMIEELGIEAVGSSQPAADACADEDEQDGQGRTKRRRSKRVIEGFVCESASQENNSTDTFQLTDMVHQLSPAMCKEQPNSCNIPAPVTPFKAAPGPSPFALPVMSRNPFMSPEPTTPSKPCQPAAQNPSAFTPFAMPQQWDAAGSQQAPQCSPFAQGHLTPFAAAYQQMPQDLVQSTARAESPLPWELSPSLFEPLPPTQQSQPGGLTQATLDMASTFLDDDFEVEPWLLPGAAAMPPPPPIPQPPKGFFTPTTCNAGAVAACNDDFLSTPHCPTFAQDFLAPSQPLPSSYAASPPTCKQLLQAMFSSSLSSGLDCIPTPRQLLPIKSEQWVAPYAVPLHQQRNLATPMTSFTQQPSQGEETLSPFMLSAADARQADVMAIFS